MLRHIDMLMSISATKLAIHSGKKSKPANEVSTQLARPIAATVTVKKTTNWKLQIM
jgi:mannose/fructose/N-acetylgalactosamine-specific phosphotransferase system component IIC